MEKWESWKNLAKTLRQSNFLPTHFKTDEQVIAVMMKGKEMNLPTMFALDHLFPVNGKIGFDNQCMEALILDSGLLDTLDIIQNDNPISCTVKMKRKGMDYVHSETYTLEDAKIAGLYPSKDNWKKYPKQCCKARAYTNCGRVMFADITGGMYTVDELSNGSLTEYVEIPSTELGNDSTQVVEKVIDTFDPESGFEYLRGAIEKMSKTKCKEEDYTIWWNQNKDDIPKLSEKKQKIIMSMHDAEIRRFTRNVPSNEVTNSQTPSTIQQEIKQ